MSSLDLELDSRIDALELQWRQAYEASIIARADFHSIASNPKARPSLLEMSRERLNRIEAAKARIMGEIERLENSLLGSS